MKKQALLIAAILIITSKGLNAQRVGIGTASPDVSAQLHIESNDKGLLVPRVSLTSLTAAAPVVSPAFGLVVFNTNGVLPGGYGLFYWNGLGWLKLQTADGGWNVSGNSFQPGDYPVLGTLNNKPLRFIMNGIPSGFTDSSNTHIGFKAGMQRTTAKNTVAIGNGALFVNTTISGLVAVGDSALFYNGAGAVDQYDGEANTAIGSRSLQQNTIGGDNTAVGYETMKNNINGYSNTAVGTLAMKYVTDGNNNTALGSYALGTLVSGDANTGVGSFALAFNKNAFNTAVGYQSLMYNSADVAQGHLAINNNAFGNQTLYSNRTGANNIGIGDFSLYSNRNGNNNVALGYRTGYSNTGSGNVFIGNTAGLLAKSDNKLYIENSTADSNNALIYGDFAADSLKLNARVVVRDVLQVKGYGAFIDNTNLWAYSPGLAAPIPGLPPVSGEGRRMMWFADKAAFRVGYVSATQWNTENIGHFSFATGYDTRASGHRSAAFGNNTLASADDAIAAGAGSIAAGPWSVAMGNSVTASSNYSIAFGSNARALANGAFASGSYSVASGVYSTAMGNRAHATARGAVAFGDSARAWGEAAVALGYYNMALNNFSTAMGVNTKAYGEGAFTAGTDSYAYGHGSVSMGSGSRTTGTGSFAVGESTVARGYHSVALGMFNDSIITADQYGPSLANPLFIVGNGSADNNRRNAFVVYNNGNADANGYFRIGRPAGGSPDFAGIENGYGVAGKQADAGKIQYGGFGGNTHWLNIVGGGTNAGGADRVIKLWSEAGMRIRGNTLPDTDNTFSLGQSGARWSAVWAVNGVIQTSDARLKTNITTLNYGLQELMQLKPVQFNWKNDAAGEKEIGFLAQDIQKLIPEAVVAPANGDALGVKYAELIPVLVNAIQEQQKEIEALKKLLLTRDQKQGQ